MANKYLKFDSVTEGMIDLNEGSKKYNKKDIPKEVGVGDWIERKNEKGEKVLREVTNKIVTTEGAIILELTEVKP